MAKLNDFLKEFYTTAKGLMDQAGAAQTNADGRYETPWGGTQSSPVTQAQLDAYEKSQSRWTPGSDAYIKDQERKAQQWQSKLAEAMRGNVQLTQDELNRLTNEDYQYLQSLSNQGYSNPYQIPTSPGGSTVSPTGTSTPTGQGEFAGEGLELYQPDKFPRSYSGLGNQYLDQLMPTLIDDLLASIQGFDANVDKTYKAAMDVNNLNTKDLLSGVLEGTVNNMSGRGILDSSITSDAIGTATGEVLKNVQNQNMQAGLEAAKMHLSKPSLLSDLTKLGQYSYSEDPSVPVKTLASLFL
jgi:hypothetical protein